MYFLVKLVMSLKMSDLHFFFFLPTEFWGDIFMLLTPFSGYSVFPIIRVGTALGTHFGLLAAQLHGAGWAGKAAAQKRGNL